MVCGGLWLMYPRQDLELRLATSGESELATAYLDNLLRSDADNPRLRLLLAQRQIAHDDTASARATLQPALASPDQALRKEALWAQGELLQREYQHALEHHTDQRQAAFQALQQHIRLLAQQSWPVERQRQLAALASQHDEVDIALDLNRQEAPLEPREAALFYEQQARQALARGDYEGCARLYLSARASTPEADQAKAYYNAAVAALRSGNQPAAALTLAERELGPLADDPNTLFMLTQLARAAGRPDVAEHYVRRLLHMALQQQATQWAAAPYDDGASLLVHPALRLALPVADKPAAAQPPALPFDDKTYTLGYEVFLENRKLDDAWAIANAAVRQNPADMRWRERLAQVSEWTQRPAVALENWLAVARQTNQPAAWQAVLRLAPGQFDDAALVQALRHQLRGRPEDLGLMRALVDAQERLGEPEPAIAYLRQHARSPAALELLARLAERAGQPDLALDSWRQLLADPAQITAERAMHAAVLALQHQQPDLGLQWLQAVQERPPAAADGAAELWRFTAGLAESRESNQLAIAAYRKLLATQQAEVDDYDALIRLLQRQHPLEAAPVALLAWDRYDEPRHLIEALSMYANHHQWSEFGRALALLDAAPGATRHSLARLRQSAQFLRLVGGYHQDAGRPAQARADYEAALRLDPGSSDTRQALLWLLIDGNDARALRELLARHEPAWSAEEELHDSLAGAYQALSLPQVALTRYLTPHVAEHQGDFLWLMNYADALEQNQESDRAWRLRRHLLSQQWQAAQQGANGQRLSRAQARQRWLTEEGLDATRRIARARLVLMQQPGDPAQEVLRELLRLDGDAQGNYSNAAAETAIGWLQDAGEYSAERGFLRHQYARSQAQRANRPLWAEITLALAEDDKAATGQLLQQFDERLPRYDRINAAVAVGDVRLAQSAAFETQGDQPDDNPLHLQLSDNLLAFSDQAGTRLARRQLGVLDENQVDAQFHLAISPRLSLELDLSRIRRSVAAPDLLRDVAHEEIAAVLLRWRHADGETRVRAANRRGYATTTPLSLEHEQRLDNRLSLRGELGWHLPSEESVPLRMGGMKTRVTAHLRYQATRQDSLLLSRWSEQYRLQTGAEVGRGRHTAVEYMHALRQEAPTWELGAFWSSHRFERRHPFFLGQEGLELQQRFMPPGAGAMGIDYFLPQSFQFYGLRLSSNMRYAQDYTRALRPYASLSLTHHSLLGAGYDLRLGLAGSWLGADHLRLGFGLSKSGVQSLGLTRLLEMSYRLHF
ncbi:MAG: tetratricopeptide repeat protein [Proteobacteria bacterium]|nr:tetratricopeptide repeat protein [Pseudomonadota bacterium]